MDRKRHTGPACRMTVIGPGYSTPLPSIDFETYSEAGYVWRDNHNRWVSVSTGLHGLAAVGASVYTEHPTCEVLSLAYNLHDNRGECIWIPGMQPPYDLFRYIGTGGLLQAWNSMFEYLVWSNVCTPRMNWPPLPLHQLRDTAAKARATGLPGRLATAGEAIRAPIQKLTDGTRLLNKFSKPRNPTKNNPSRRLKLTDDPIDASRLIAYNVIDIQSEACISALCPDLTPQELEVWQLDQRINSRGVMIDTPTVANCIRIIEEVKAKETAELREITNGNVGSAAELQNLLTWLHSQNVHLANLTAEEVETALEDNTLAPAVRRALEIRASLSLSSVMKLYAIQKRVSRDGRLRDLFAYCGADRTGRFAGRGPQPQNLPGGHPAEALPFILADIRTLNASALREKYGDPIALISGCLRSVFVASPGHDLICSDYSSIEAVVLAVMAGEQWRIEVFRNQGDIYAESAARISGIPVAPDGSHPLRKKVGKIAELASGYQGSVGAWKRFGANEHIGSDDQILQAVRQWRTQSPNIVRFWYDIEDTARLAILHPGQCYSYRGISYGVKDDILLCKLPSGRLLWYREPRLTRTERFGREVLRISYMGKDGPTGQWVRIDTYGGKLTENIVQAISRDILCHAMLQLDKAGYPIVLHVHDEIVAEVPHGTAWFSVEEFENIMGQLPSWAEDWPIRATGGWRGSRYRKE